MVALSVAVAGEVGGRVVGTSISKLVLGVDSEAGLNSNDSVGKSARAGIGSDRRRSVELGVDYLQRRTGRGDAIGRGRVNGNTVVVPREKVPVGVDAVQNGLSVQRNGNVVGSRHGDRVRDGVGAVEIVEHDTVVLAVCRSLVGKRREEVVPSGELFVPERVLGLDGDVADLSGNPLND